MKGKEREGYETDAHKRYHIQQNLALKVNHSNFYSAFTQLVYQCSREQVKFETCVFRLRRFFFFKGGVTLYL